MNDRLHSECEIRFSAGEPFFKGHFPGRPVTPGVMLIDRAVAAAEKLLGRKLALKGMRKVKFSNPVLPGESVRLELVQRAEDEVSYVYSKESARVASGTLVF